jgi:hypothetical protein
LIYAKAYKTYKNITLKQEKEEKRNLTKVFTTHDIQSHNGRMRKEDL